MIVIDGDTVQLTEAEEVIKEGVDRLLNRGFCMECSVKLLLGVDIPEEVRAPAPATEALLVGPFLEWLIGPDPVRHDLPEG